MRIGKYLYFYMSWIYNKFFYVNGIIAKCRIRFKPCLLKSVLEFILAFGYTHTLSATAGRSLDQYRISDCACNFECRLNICHRSVRSRHYRDTRLFHHFPCCRFVPHKLYHFCRRTYKFNPVILTKPRKFRVFRKKSKPRMYSITSGSQCRLDNVAHF